MQNIISVKYDVTGQNIGQFNYFGNINEKVRYFKPVDYNEKASSRRRISSEYQDLKYRN